MKFGHFQQDCRKIHNVTCSIYIKVHGFLKIAVLQDVILYFCLEVKSKGNKNGKWKFTYGTVYTKL